MTHGLATPPQWQGRPLPAKPGMLHPRLAAAAAGALSYVFMLSTHTNPVAVALAAVMTAACVPCAVSLWRRGDPGSARMPMAVSLAMVTIHGFMLTQVQLRTPGIPPVPATLPVGERRVERCR